MEIQTEKNMKSHHKPISSNPPPPVCAPMHAMESMPVRVPPSSGGFAGTNLTGITAVIGRDLQNGYVLSVRMTGVVENCK
jgi:hypothetical protein